MKGQRGVAFSKQSFSYRDGPLRPSIAVWFLTSLALACTLLVGCSQMRLPKIDPNGTGLFVNGDTTEVTRPFKDTEKLRELPTIIPKPAFRAPAPGTSSDEGLMTKPNDQGQNQPQLTPGMIWVSPKIVAAPIGSGVVLKAGLVGSKKQLLADRKLEWTVAEGSQGIIESAGGGNPNTFRWLFPKYGNRASETYAHTITSQRAEVVHQDTVDYIDDIDVAQGEAWAVVSSDRKGTTEVLVGASTETNWDRRFQKILVHWIDAQWQFPNSVTDDAGSDQVLTTIVTRPSNNTPLSGWTVRYKLVSNRQATLSSQSNNEQLDTIDVTTDSQGKASIRVSPSVNQAGVVYVTTEIIRPADVSIETPALVVGKSTAGVTWNSPGLSLSCSSPKIVELGKTIDCVLTISNPGNQTATNVTLNQVIPVGLLLDSSNPVATLNGNQAIWDIGDLTPQTQKQLTVRYTTGQAGASDLSFLVTCDEGLESDAGSLTNVITAPLEITIEGPRIAKLGDDLQFQILLHNTSTEPISGLNLLETLGPGLIHISKSNPLGNPSVRKLAFQSRTIQPNSTTVKAISMRATRAGTLCHTLEARLPNGLVLEKEVCLEISAPIQPETTSAPIIEANIISEQVAQAWEVGKTNTKRFQVSNQSKQPITNVLIKATLPTQLQAQLASEGHRSEGPSILLDIPTLLPGQTRTLIIQMLATEAGAELLIQMEVSGDAIAKIVKTGQTTIINNAADNPLDLSPPSGEDPMEEGEPMAATEQPIPDLNPAKMPNKEAPNPAHEGTFQLNELPDQPNDPMPPPSVDENTFKVEPSDSLPEQIPESTFTPATPPDKSDEPLDTLSLNTLPLDLSLPAEQSAEGNDFKSEVPSEPEESSTSETKSSSQKLPDEPTLVLSKLPATTSKRPALSPNVLTLSNPISVGEENVFFVYLNNNGDSEVTNIVIQMQTSEHLELISLEQKETDSGKFPNALDGDNRAVSIPAIARLAAGTSIRPYQIKVKAIQKGKGTISASINADGLENTIEIDEEVAIVPAK